MNTKQRYPLFKEHRFLSGGHEQFPGVNEKSAHLIFKDEDGKVRAGCYFGDDDFPIFDLGIIPNKISTKSPEAINKYASSRMQSMMRKERKRRIEGDHRVKNLQHHYELNHHGVVIKGYVKKGVDNGPRDDRFILFMTEPFQIQVELFVRPCCFADGMAGVQSLDDDGNLLPEEISRQEEELIDLYKRELRKRNRRPKHPALASLPTISDLDEE